MKLGISPIDRDFRRRIKPLLVLAIGCLLAVTVGCGSLTSTQVPPANRPGQSQALSTDAPSSLASSAGSVRVRDLPTEAKTTLQLIKAGGPFPFSKDGAVFNNFERLLPEKAVGYYHEYTVITPGAADRGARRIIAGKGGEYYYTDDHYVSFRLIVE